MTRCSVCHQELIINKTEKGKPQKHRQHAYCRWRFHNFWKQDLCSVLAFFSFGLVCFLFLILAGGIGKEPILRNTAYLVLVWTILFTLWLWWINYLKLVRECCRHQGTTYRFWQRHRRMDDEIVTKKDIVE